MDTNEKIELMEKILEEVKRIRNDFITTDERIMELIKTIDQLDDYDQDISDHYDRLTKAEKYLALGFGWIDGILDDLPSDIAIIKGTL